MTDPTVDGEAERLRHALVRKLRRDGLVHSRRVEHAFRLVPRHLFLPEVDVDIAYRNINIPTKLQAGEAISSSSQPAIMAIMLEQLAPAPGDNVLEVGAGTGYNAALLSEIVGASGRVTTIDLDADIVERARRALTATGYTTVQVEQQDGFAGFAANAPYDRIIATVGLGDIPFALWVQLKSGGQLVLPLSMRGTMKSVAFRKDASGRLIGTSISPAGFMPLRGVHPLSTREVRLGPELGLYAQTPSDRGPLDDAALYRVLSGDYADIPTTLEVSRASIRNGLVLWLRGHCSTTLTVHAEGALADANPVPGLLRSPWAWPPELDRLSIGLWDGRELALLGPGSSTRPAADDRPFPLSVRAFGGRALAEHLIETARAWVAAGAPTEEQLHLRLLPRGETSQAAASIPMDAGTLELAWSEATAALLDGANQTGDSSTR